MTDWLVDASCCFGAGGGLGEVSGRNDIELAE